MTMVSFSNTLNSVNTLSGCTPKTLLFAAGKGIAVCAMMGGTIYVGSLVKRGVIQLAKKVIQFWPRHQFPNGTVLESELLTVGGTLLMSMSGLSHPYLTIACAGITAAANYVLFRNSMTTHEPEEGEPITINGSSPLNIDAENCLFTIPPNQISCHSAGAALELLKTTPAYRSAHRVDLENRNAQQIRDYFGSHPLLPTQILHNFDCGGQALNLLNVKYGIGSPKLTLQQVENRSALLATWGHPLRHPRIPGVPLSEDQLSGWLTDIRKQIYTEAQQPPAVEEPTKATT